MKSFDSFHLVGRIEHIVTSSCDNAGKENGKKRPRPWENDSTAHSSANAINQKGYIFVCCQESSRSFAQFGRVFHLVVPLSLIRAASHAAATGKIAQLSRFTLICYQNGRGGVVFDSRDMLDVDGYELLIEGKDSDDHAPITVAEVHSNGLCIKDNEVDSTTIYSQETLDPPILTLEMLAAKEQSLSKKEKKSAKLPMNITATVDAISPIFTHDKERPFALMELYHQGDVAYTAVAVLRGDKALCMHGAIQPGQNITLVGVVNRSWKVSDGFREFAQNAKDDVRSRFYDSLFQRTPDRVILVGDPNNITFDDDQHDKALPSTVQSLKSVRGVIESVHYFRYEDTRSNSIENIIHFVTVRQFTQQEPCSIQGYNSYGNEDPSSRIGRINLLKYCLSPHVKLGLQVGAVVRAINIHPITSTNASDDSFVACLRSTISIECCASSSGDLRSPWFISNSLSFNVVPNHRIAKICSDCVGSIPSTRYFDEDFLRSKAQNLQLNNDLLVRALLAHHYKKEKSDLQIMSNNSKGVTFRDPYSEFFDHAHSNEQSFDRECGSCADDDMHKFCSIENASSPSTPNIVRLDALLDTCVQDFIKKVAKHCYETRSNLSSGSTSSYYYYSSKSYVWGQIALEQFTSSGIIRHGNREIPFSVALDEAERNALGQLTSKFEGWLQVKSVRVTSLCLGRVQLGVQTGRRMIKHKFLASTAATISEEVLGHNFVFIVDDLIFVGSIHFIAVLVVCDDLRKYSTPNQACAAGKRSAMSIQDCLKQTSSDDGFSGSVIGKLIRQRFQFRKVRRSQSFEGWTITLSHIDESQNNCLSSSSLLQTIEVKVTIPADNPSDFQWTSLKTTLRDMLLSCRKFSDDHSDPLYKVSTDQLNMGSAFLHISAKSSTRPLLSGGFESCNNRLLAETRASSTLRSMSIRVEIPITSREFSKLGYQRFKCRLEDIRSITAVETLVIPRYPCPTYFFDFAINTHKFLPGMVSRRLARNGAHATTNGQNGNAIKNTYTALDTLSGDVVSASLADLHYDVCKVLSEKQHTYLRPSLLRRIRGAKILGISFCRARVECTGCFEFLRSSKSQDRTLICPSGCRADNAAVKWECSAVIDDGTGQAKLYAEREAALLLLGSSLDVDSVEQGALVCQDGVFFQPSLPPSAYLQSCMKEASIEAKKHNTQLLKEDREAFRKSKPATAHDFITTLAKAEYLLQRHCRQWYHKHHQLKLDLFCRCKPLSTDATSVNRTEIQMAKAIDGCGLDFGAVQTSTLPPLKLILDDICLAGETNQDDNSTAWDMLSALGKR